MVLALDLAWSRFSSDASVKSAEQYWQDAFFSSLAPLLYETEPNEYEQLAESIIEDIGLDIVIETLDKIHLETHISHQHPGFSTIEIGGENYLLATYPATETQVRIGPLPYESRWLSSAVTLGFYLLFGLLVWIWIRPIVNGLDQLSIATSRFAHNYQEPLPELNVQSPVKELAESIESMAEQIRSLIQTQIELTGGLSHEIRTPLARIKFALATARSRLGEHQQFDSINQDVEELEQLVGAMLDYSRLQQTQEILKWQSGNAKQLFEELADKYRWRSAACIEADTAPDQMIHGDIRLLSLALSNLMVNASRYAKDQIHIEFSVEKDIQRLYISDDGPGIPEEKRSQALEPFKKNARDEDMSDGFGLGLAIVKRILKLHDGTVDLQESFTGGLKVSLSWPLTRTQS